MKHVYAFESSSESERYQARISRFTQKLSDYQRYLEADFELKEPPEAFVWTSEELATTVFSKLPIPAFTNRHLIYISPDLDGWRQLFLRQLEDKHVPEIRPYYEQMPEAQVLTIAGHELTHHLDLFPGGFEDAREDSIWFEEGMCDYLSRSFFLSNDELQKITEVETELVSQFQEQYGTHSLNTFGQESYSGTLTSIMFDYWRSFLTGKELVERSDDDILTIFKAYQHWYNHEKTISLTDYFEI
ncbi:hypothetical protein [Alkalicoccus luteus]|uniref:hypothetical protein n=1 Tax=Alkalicoccus luteus TaxID=1237094 RepID=UPI004033A9BF